MTHMCYGACMAKFPLTGQRRHPINLRVHVPAPQRVLLDRQAVYEGQTLSGLISRMITEKYGIGPDGATVPDSGPDGDSR